MAAPNFLLEASSLSNRVYRPWSVIFVSVIISELVC